jgi:hypothetical protein
MSPSGSASSSSTDSTTSHPQSLETSPSDTQTSRGVGALTPAQPQSKRLPPSSGGTSRTGDNRGGAAGKDIAECMAVWDAGTHMTKQEWRATCERSLSNSPTVLIPELPPDNAVR